MSNHALFSVIGIEIEYMLVDKETLAIQPKSDLVLTRLAGELVNEVALGDISASNELVLHVIELKNNGPKPAQGALAAAFQKTILQLQPILDEFHLRLLPTGAHPWMNPALETKRWPHGNRSIYQQYDAIFDCKGHGWSNLQSMHVNLPFANDDEFCQLHNLIRLLLPLLPALAASSPFLDGKKTGFLDSRLDFYGKNQQLIPSICGEIIPPFIRSEEQYHHDVLEPMYAEISPFDPEGVLQYEWLNSRGAIPKFGQMAVEIRILDPQECVHADIAIAKLIHAVLKRWHESGITQHLEQPIETATLKAIYERSLKTGLAVVVDDEALLTQWHLPKHHPQTLTQIWSWLIEQVSSELDHPSQHALEHILRHGNLSERILRACEDSKSKKHLIQVYRTMGDCLIKDQQFDPKNPLYLS